MRKPPTDTLLSSDPDARDSLFHPVLLALNSDDGPRFMTFTGIASIEFNKGEPNTKLPFRVLPTEVRFVMVLLGEKRAEFVEVLDDFALWTPRYAEFFDLHAANPLLLLDAFEQ